MECSFEGCGRRSFCRGFCRAHYDQLRAGKPLATLQRKSPKGIRVPCSFGGCERNALAGGLCSGHYQQHKRGIPLRPFIGRGPSEIRIYDDRAEIVLMGRGVEVGVAIIDVEDVPLVSSYRWRCSCGYADSHSNGGTRLHRLLMECPDGLEVDHIDGDPLNNRRSNLRIVTRAQNCQNLAVAGREHLRGVSFRPAEGTWMAYTTANHRMVYTCGLRSEEEAREEARRLREAHMTHHNERRHSN